MPRSSTRAAATKAKAALTQATQSDGEAFDASGAEKDWDADDGASLSEDEDEMQDWAEEDEAPPAKKPRTSVGRGKQKKRDAPNLLSLPLETLTTIASYLDLPSIFYLWEKARERSLLPELTAPGMDVYSYVNLMFGNCRGCGKKTPKVDYVLRIRTCKKCTPDYIRDRDTDDGAEGLVVYSNRTYCSWLIDFEPLCEDIESSYAGVEEVTNDAGWQAWMTKCESLQKQRDEDAVAIVAWLEVAKKNAEKERLLLCEKRREEIEKRLLEIGWRPHQLGPLSDGDWDVYVRDEAETYLQRSEPELDLLHLGDERWRRSARLQSQYTKLCAGGEVRTALERAALPPWDEFRNLPAVRKLWYVDLDGSYAPTPVLAEHQAPLHADLADARVALESSIFYELLELSRIVDKDLAGETSTSSTLAFPHVPVLAPLIPPPADPSLGYTKQERHAVVSRATSVQLSLRPSNYRTHINYFKAGLHLSAIAGKGPSATAQELDRAGFGFTCLNESCQAERLESQPVAFDFLSMKPIAR
ncbi:hypothetical protein JCM10207_006258 [Rhodosporidiobolus poonsookiae]